MVKSYPDLQSLELGESGEAAVVDDADEVAGEIEGLEGAAERGHGLGGHLGELVVPHAPGGNGEASLI